MFGRLLQLDSSRVSVWEQGLLERNEPWLANPETFPAIEKAPQVDIRLTQIRSTPDRKIRGFLLELLPGRRDQLAKSALVVCEAPDRLGLTLGGYLSPLSRQSNSHLFQTPKHFKPKKKKELFKIEPTL